ncbi:MAG: hypothetical protein ACSLE0_23475 [Chitinophagaceae bacterium]
MKREHKVICDFGMGDYHKFYLANNEVKVDRKTFSDIITEFNTELRDLIILENLIYSMPGTNFQLVLKKDKRKPTIKDGKLINNIPIDWKTTNALWERDAEAKEKKLLVRYNNSHTSHYVYRIYFKKFGAKIKFKSVYKFQVNRDFRRLVNRHIKNPNVSVDAFLLYKNQI